MAYSAVYSAFLPLPSSIVFPPIAPSSSLFLISLSLSFSVSLVFRHSFRWLELRAEIQRYRSVSIPPACFIFRAVKVDLSWTARELLLQRSSRDTVYIRWEWVYLSIKYLDLPSIGSMTELLGERWMLEAEMNIFGGRLGRSWRLSRE